MSCAPHLQANRHERVQALAAEYARRWPMRTVHRTVHPLPERDTPYLVSYGALTGETLEVYETYAFGTLGHVATVELPHALEDGSMLVDYADWLDHELNG